MAISAVLSKLGELAVSEARIFAERFLFRMLPDAEACMD
jgi:hypothetical protein